MPGARFAGVIVILNNSAGSPTVGEQLRQQVAESFRAHGLAPEIWLAEGGAEILAFAKKAVDSADETIVAGGGDGTINCVAGALLGTGKRLGVLPLGTLNHFARDLGIPPALDAAAATVAAGRERWVDVGEVNGRVFLNNASLGLYPRIVRSRTQQQERLGRGKWHAFALALFSALHVFRTQRLWLHIDGKVMEVRTPFLFVGNNAYRMDLLKVGGREQMDGGVLSAYFARGTGRLGLIPLACRSLIGRLRQAKNFEVLNVPEFHVKTHKRSRHIATDGEVTRMDFPLHFRIRPRALRVIA